MDTEKERGCYFRFRNCISPFGVVITYSNPVSISSVASLSLVVALHVYSSSSLTFSSCVYFSVFIMFLCPSCCMTNSMSFVFAYSLVAK